VTVIARQRSVRVGVALVAVVGLVVAGCTHPPGKPEPSTTRPTLPPRTTGTTTTTRATVPARSVLDGTSWVLVPSSLAVPVPDGVTVTADFQNRRVTGSSGCNVYFADAGADPSGRFVIGDIGSTDRACENAVGEVEADYLTRLGGARSYVIVGDELRLSGLAGTVRFRRVDAGPASDALVGHWMVTAFVHQSTHLLAGARAAMIPELGFAADGTMWARVCFSRGAHWSVTGDRLALSEFWGPDTECSASSGQAEDEADVLAALRAARSWSITPATLTLVLSDDAGGVLMRATRAR
jgi:heat shock protein HslJ